MERGRDPAPPCPVAMQIHELETPCAVVDLDRMFRNLDRAARYATEHKLALRPHVKTHKTAWIAAEQLQRGAAGVTCATPREAEVMSGVCDDILLAYPPVGAKAPRLAELAPDLHCASNNRGSNRCNNSSSHPGTY